MHLVLQDRRRAARHTLPAILERTLHIVVAGTVPDDVGFLHMCAHHQPSAGLIELDVDEWNVPELVATVRRRHPRLRLVGVGDAAVDVDVKVPVAAGFSAVVQALRNFGSEPAGSGTRDEHATTDHLLNPRQLEILGMISQGRSTREIAQALRLSAGTIAYHKREMFTRLGARSQAQAVASAIRLGVLEDGRP